VSRIELKVNGRSHTLDVEPDTPLLYVLRNDLDLRGPRFGCGLGQCGACKVIINGAAVFSCITPVSSVKGEITTLEGLAQNGRLHPVQQAWIAEQAPQCGFCQNGQIMTAKALLDKNPHPTDAQIREAMNGTLCRCMSYFRVQSAIKRAVKTIAESAPSEGKRVIA
jgi:aerobic-type carbon monoxide dehydrogenase small subunit (CoxS/CutS family)